MHLNIISALSFFMLIVISTVAFYVSKRLKLPYTVILVLVGLLIVPISHIPYFENIFGFINNMALTPEVLFYIFLPVLIFESGFNMSIRKMLDSIWAISFLAIPGLIVAATLIATGLYFALPLIGIEIPFIIALLFGVIISPTDPVAVLSIFKEVGVPRRLSLIFEGESLVNDGTAMALFFVVLHIATDGFHGSETILHGSFGFMTMIVLGIAFGLIMASIFSRAIHFTKNNEFVTVTLLIISAHMVFIGTELINHSGIVHISPIISTTVSSLFLGNYSRNILAPRIDEYLSKLIEHMAFVVNSLVFIMAGLLFANSGVNFGELWLPILLSVFIVVFARAMSVFSVLPFLNLLKLEKHIPLSWQKLLAWGSLRGALAIILVMLIPEDFTVNGWNFDASPRDFIIALTVGCILASLFVKALTIIPITRRYKLDQAEPLKQAHETDFSVFYLLTELDRLKENKVKGFLTAKQYEILVSAVKERLETVQKHRDILSNQYGEEIFEQSLHMAMVHVEKLAVKRLFINQEVSESVYRMIHSKLLLQEEKIELAQHKDIDQRVYTDRKNIFDRLVKLVQFSFEDKSKETFLQNRLEYYRAQMIMARKALQALNTMQNSYSEKVFLNHSFLEVTSLYKQYQKRCKQKADVLIKEYNEILTPHLQFLAKCSLSASGEKAMTYLREHGLVDEEMEEDIVHYCADKN